MSTLLTLPDMYRACGYPLATPSEVSAWNNLEDNESALAEIKVGLFGYDISCLASLCASVDNKEFYY